MPLLRSAARTLALAVFVLGIFAPVAIGCQSTSAEVPTDGGAEAAALEEVTTTLVQEDFRDLNGVAWFYTTDHGTKFTELQGRLDDLKRRGTRVLGIYSPYHGDKAKWLGCAPLDFYATTPESGTLDEFRALVSAAHAKGMKIVTYFVNVYINRDSPFFETAEQQYKAGDRTSREVSAVRWAANAQEPLPTPQAGPAKWLYSDAAGAWYFSLWDEVGFDFNLPGARAEVERIMKFWLDTGVDGFMFDAAFVDPAFKALMVDLPKSHTPNDKWLTFESTNFEEADSYETFGLTSWFALEDDDYENGYSFVARGQDTADDLEESFEAVDKARESGKLTHAWSILEGSYPDEESMRVQEAAVLAGGGMLYGLPDEDTAEGWSPTLRANWEKVLVTVNANPALWPSASRKRVPLAAGAHPKSYAMVRTSQDGTRTVLLAYNLSNEPQSVELVLDGTNIGAQTPVDLYAGGDAPPIAGLAYRIDLPAWGFRMLGVRR